MPVRRSPPSVPAVQSGLADAVLELGNQLEHPERDTTTRDIALRAAVEATRILQEDPGLSVSVIVGQVRSTAVDLLRGSGMTSDEARAALESAVERASAAP